MIATCLLWLDIVIVTSTLDDLVTIQKQDIVRSFSTAAVVEIKTTSLPGKFVISIAESTVSQIYNPPKVKHHQSIFQYIFNKAI